MVFQIRFLKPIITFLNELDIPYMVIGGIAIAERGRVRTTEDADLKIFVQGRTISEFRALAESRFKPHHRPWLGKSESALIVSVEVEDDMVVDMLASILPYEEQAIQRAETIVIDGLALPVCAAEDLIIHKAISNRHHDWYDIEGVIIRQRGKLDVKYIRHWLKQFAEALETPEMLTRFEKLYEENK
jgi:predicted nucleotidyltransferase